MPQLRVGQVLWNEQMRCLAVVTECLMTRGTEAFFAEIDSFANAFDIVEQKCDWANVNTVEIDPMEITTYLLMCEEPVTPEFMNALQRFYP